MSKAKKKALGKWLILFLVALLFASLVKLGFWQLARADQKRNLLAQWQASAVDIQQHSKDYYRKVKVEGVLDARRYFLLDNRTREGRVGYEVIVPMTLSLNRQTLMVNLGWIAASVDRSILPQIDIPPEVVVIEGWLKKVEPSFQLAHNAWQVPWPKRIQSLNVMKFEQVLARELYLDYVLLAKEPLLSNSRVDWQPVSMSPQRHLGYAVQWFALALALGLLVLWFYRKQVGEVKEVVDAR